MNILLKIQSLPLFVFLWIILESEAVTVNFRNMTFGSLADRIALANQQKLQLQNQQYEAAQALNVVITTPTTTTTGVPITLASASTEMSVPIPVVIVEERPFDPTVNESSSANNPGNQWCNVSVFKKHRVTWLSAYRTCKSLGNGTELASIKTTEDYNTFVSNVKAAGSPASVIYWTSGTDILDEGVFVWMSDGSDVTQTWWAPGQPDNHWDTEHCIAFKRYSSDRNYKMTDENCLLAGGFLCVRPCF